MGRQWFLFRVCFQGKPTLYLHSHWVKALFAGFALFILHELKLQINFIFYSLWFSTVDDSNITNNQFSVISTVHSHKKSPTGLNEKAHIRFHYRPPTKLREGNVFSRVCVSVILSTGDWVSCNHYPWYIWPHHRYKDAFLFIVNRRWYDSIFLRILQENA